MCKLSNLWIAFLVSFIVPNWTFSSEMTFKEHTEWHPEFKDLITAKSIEDQDGNTLIRQTFQYDETGKLEKETAWKWEDGSYYVQHEYFYQDECNRLKKTSIESYAPFSFQTSSTTYGLIDSIKSYFFPEPEYVQEKGHPAGQIPFGHTVWHLVDCGNLPIQTGTFVQDEANDKVRISFVSGILNLKQDHMNSIERLSEDHGGISIHYVFQPTEGFSWDILKCSLCKLGFTSPQALALAKMWKSLIAEMGGVEGNGRIIHYAHSIGGTNTLAAKSLLTPEEQKMIKVFTFGSPTIVPKEGFDSVINYISVRDGVPLLDPIGRMHALFYDNSHVIYVGSYWGLPFVDHLLYGQGYSKVINAHAKEFKNLYIMP